MRIEGQHGDARLDDSEIAHQRLVHHLDFRNDQLLGQRLFYLVQRDVPGDNPDPDRIVHHQHQVVVAVELFGKIFGLPMELETRRLYVFLVDRRGNHHVDDIF